MGQAEVGALRVRLGMDAGEFNREADKAESRLDKLAMRFGLTAGAAAAAGGMIATGIVGAITAIVSAVPDALTAMDDIGKSAQKIGTSVQALSELAHAADLSDVSIEQLTVASGILAKNLQKIASGDTTSAAARSFDALGISIRTTSGQVKSFDVILAEVSEKFAGYEDGANKTALAMTLFGKSGAQLIPLLNSGRDGLAEMRAEAVALGITFDLKASKAAEVYNDNLTRMSALSRGFSVTLAREVAPALAELSTRTVDSAKAMNLVENAAAAASVTFKSVASVVLGLTTQIQNAATATMAFFRIFGMLQRGEIMGAAGVVGEAFTTITQRTAEAEASIKRLWGTLAATPAEAARAAAGLQGLGSDTAEPKKPDAPEIENLTKQKEAQSQVNAEFAKYLELQKLGKDIQDELNPVQAKLIEDQERLGRAFQKGAIDAATYGQALQRASFVAQSAYAGMASSIVSDLGKVFENNKAVAIAQALINTYQSVTNALANVPWPLNYAAAAASLAAGLAQVANIRSTSKNSKGGGGGSGSLAAASTAAEGPRQQQGVFINLQGDHFSREAVRGLISQINDAVADGAVLQVA